MLEILNQIGMLVRSALRNYEDMIKEELWSSIYNAIFCHFRIIKLMRYSFHWIKRLARALKSSFFNSFSNLRLLLSFLVVFLQTGKVFLDFIKHGFFQAIAHKPMSEGLLLQHRIELVVQSLENSWNGSWVGQHAQRSFLLSNISIREHTVGLIRYADSKASRAPIDKLNGSLGLNIAYTIAHILRNNIPSVSYWAAQELACPWVTSGELIGRLKQIACQL